MDKDQLRREVQENRARLQKEEFLKESNQILNTLLKQAEFKNADVILCYVSFENEVDTHSLIQSALISGKQVAVPKIIKKGSMEFYQIHSLGDLHPGRFGILEPDSTEPIAYDSTKQYTMIMPGLAYDKQLHRIGYGGGYYDRYLCNYENENIIKIALAFDFQVYDSIPWEAYDYQPNILITPSKVLKNF